MDQPLHSTDIDRRTGLAPEAALRDWLARAEGPCALLLVELTNLSLIEAGAGRPVGDRLIAEAAERLAAAAGEPCFTARSGIHELAVGMAGADAVAAEVLAERLATLLAEPVTLDGRAWHLAIRIGAAAASGDRASVAALRRRATGALGEARQSDLRRVVILGPDADDALGEERLEADLAAALAGEGIRILFQPQFAVADGRIIGAEALARWDHPRLGRLGAETLFAVAGRIDMADRLSEAVQDAALARAARWPAALSDLRLSLNLVTQQVGPADAAERIAGLAARHDFPPERLTVEITETGLMDDLDHAAAALAGLRQRGIAVAIDDFGTGHSSLAYLHRLPIDAVKIDRRLTRYLGVRGRDGVIVEAVLALARALGLKSVAEGIETPDQLAALEAMQGDAWQGFLRSEPLEAEAFEAFAEAG